MNKGIFLTVRDLMELTGGYSYEGCSKQHKAIRDSLADKKRRLTIHEYCKYEKIDFDYVWKYLRE